MRTGNQVRVVAPSGDLKSEFAPLNEPWRLNQRMSSNRTCIGHAIKKKPHFPRKKWWRRRELNPRPEQIYQPRLHA
jgi:hypothetical protein